MNDQSVERAISDLSYQLQRLINDQIMPALWSIETKLCDGPPKDAQCGNCRWFITEVEKSILVGKCTTNGKVFVNNNPLDMYPTFEFPRAFMTQLPCRHWQQKPKTGE
jgi:hypothetical protein